jgi:hypothetical protein
MPCSHVKESNDPTGTPLLHIALDGGATIAEIDCHLSAFLNECFGDRLPTDVDRGTPWDGSSGRTRRTDFAQEPCLIEHVLELFLQALRPQPGIESVP